MKKLLLIILALVAMTDTLVYARGGGGGHGGHGGHGGYHGGGRGYGRGGYGRGGAFVGGFAGGMIGGMMIGGIMASSYRGQPAYNVSTEQGQNIVIVEQGGRPYVVQNDDPNSDPIPWSNAYPNDPAPDMNQLRSQVQQQGQAQTVATRQSRFEQLKARARRDLAELKAEEQRLYNEL